MYHTFRNAVNVVRTQRGFTLIELLVVVLIIGILAAAAVPQYQKAVELSRANNLKMFLKSLGNAQSVYFLQHGTYARDLEQLDIVLPFTTSHGTSKEFGEWGYYWRKWLNWDGIAVSKEWEGGGYSLQVDYASGTLICCQSHEVNLCNALGVGNYAGSTSFLVSANKFIAMSCNVMH